MARTAGAWGGAVISSAMSAALAASCAGDPARDTTVVSVADPPMIHVAEPPTTSAPPAEERTSPPRRRAPPPSGPGADALREQEIDRDRARELFREGADAYAQGDYQRACAAFEAAYELVPEQPLLFNMASCEMRMGRRDKACDLFRRYIKNGDPQDPRVAQVTQQVAARCP